MTSENGVSWMTDASPTFLDEVKQRYVLNEAFSRDLGNSRILLCAQTQFFCSQHSALSLDDKR